VMNVSGGVGVVRVDRKPPAAATWLHLRDRPCSLTPGGEDGLLAVACEGMIPQARSMGADF